MDFLPRGLRRGASVRPGPAVHCSDGWKGARPTALLRRGARVSLQGLVPRRRGLSTRGPADGAHAPVHHRGAAREHYREDGDGRARGLEAPSSNAPLLTVLLSPRHHLMMHCLNLSDTPSHNAPVFLLDTIL